MRRRRCPVPLWWMTYGGPLCGLSILIASLEMSVDTAAILVHIIGSTPDNGGNYSWNCQDRGRPLKGSLFDPRVPKVPSMHQRITALHNGKIFNTASAKSNL